MNLGEFVENFVCPNSLIKLWIPIDRGHELLMEDNNFVCMEHELLGDKVWQSRYRGARVIGVTDICCDDFYRHAINIVIQLD